MARKVAEVYNGDLPGDPRRPRHVILRELRELCQRDMSGDALAWHLERLAEVERRHLQPELPFC
jgi:hypothetical protein